MNERFVSTKKYFIAPPDREYAINCLLPMESVTVIAGREGTGKTKIALAMARAISLGERFLGQESLQGKTLYFNLDRMHVGDLEDRCRELGDLEWTKALTWFEGDFDLLSHFLRDGVVVFGKDNEPITMRSELTRYVKQQRFKLLVFDTLHKLATSSDLDERDERDMDNLLIAVRDIARDSGCAILILHHTPIAVPRGRPTEDAPEVRGRGSGAIQATVDHVLTLTGTINERLTINVAKTRTDRIHIFPIVIAEDILLTPSIVNEGEPVGAWRTMIANRVRNMDEVERQERQWRMHFSTWMTMNGEYVDQTTRCAHRSSLLELFNNNRGALNHIRDYYVPRHRLEIEQGQDAVYFFTINLDGTVD